MIRWLWKIFVGSANKPSCQRECQWEVSSHYRSEGLGDRSDGSFVADIYVLRCKTCGDLKNHRVSA